MTVNLIYGIVALIAGSLVSAVNMLISKKAFEKNSSSLSGVSTLRSFINIASLVATFFISRNSGCNIMFPLVGMAVGLTVPTIFMALSMAKKMQDKKTEESPDNQKEDEAK